MFVENRFGPRLSFLCTDSRFIYTRCLVTETYTKDIYLSDTKGNNRKKKKSNVSLRYTDSLLTILEA